MSTIYVTGHKNPDLDSVCSAYGYAKLMNLQDPDNTYVPIRCGHLSDSTRDILEQLDIDIPSYKRDDCDGNNAVTHGCIIYHI